MIKKILKISGISLLVILVLLISLPFLFKGKILNMIKQEINNNLNAKVDFVDFDIGIFKTFPYLYVELTGITIVGINEFEKDTLLNVPEFMASVDLMSVFSDKIKIKKINLDKPIFNLKVLKDGKANWDILKESTDTTTTQDTTPSNFSLALKKFSIVDAKLVYSDLSSNMFFSTEKLNFQLTGDLSADKTQLISQLQLQQTSFDYDGITFLKKGNIEINTDIDANLKDYVFTFKHNSINVNNFKILADGVIQMPGDDINIDLTYNAEKTDFKTLLSLVPAIYLKGYENIKTSGNIVFNGTVKGTYNDKQMPGFTLNLKVDNGSLKYPELPSDIKNININLAVSNKDGNPDNTIVDLKQFYADVANNPVNAKLLMTNPITNAYLKGIVKANLDLSKVSSFYPLDKTTIKGIVDVDVIYETKMSAIEQEKYDEVEAKGYIKLTDFQYSSPEISNEINIPTLETEVTPKYFDLKKLFMKLGNSDISLNGKIENFLAYLFKDELLKAQFNLESNVLNINQLLSATNTSQTSTEQNTQDTSQLQAPELPKNVDFVFQSSVKQLLYDNLDIKNMKGKITLSNGKLELDNLQFVALDGTFNMKAKYSYTDMLPEANFEFDMKNIDIKQTFETFSIVKKTVPLAEHCKGKVSINLKMETKFDKNLNPILNTVQANGMLNIPSVVVENTEFGKKLSEFLKNNSYESLKIENIKATFSIKDGNITIEPVKSKINNIPFEFSGSQNLDQTMNYDLLLTVPKNALGNKANELFANWSGMATQAGIPLKVPDNIPVKCAIRGTINKPEIKFNLKDIAKESAESIKEAVKEKINEEIDKAKSEAIRKAQEEADRILKEAEQRANQIISAAEAAAKQINETARQTAQQIRNEAEVKASQIEKEGKEKGPIAEKIAKESANKIRKEADKKANEIETKAQQESQAKLNQAKQEAEQIRINAKNKADNIIEEAKKK